VRIAWFTPFATRSAIGEFGRHVTAALAAHADVDIWTADQAPLHQSDLRIIHFNGAEDLDGARADYDALVYNMGNYLAFHGEIHAVSQRHPGIVILHDRVLHHMFSVMWQSAPESVDVTYVSRMATYYGAAGETVARESVTGVNQPVWERDDEVVKYPLDEEALQHALGAVTHAQDHARYLRDRWFGPVRALALPVYRDVLATAAQKRFQDERRADGRIQLTSIGHVIPNKNVGSVIEMLAADAELATMVHYTIVGSLDAGSVYVEQLERLLRAAPELSVDILGWRETDELDQLMAATDVFVNLRQPVMESGSASLARELAFGRAVLCFDQGYFSELPPDAVARVPSGDFDAAAAALRRLVLDADHRREIGANALRLAGDLGEDHYAQALIEFIDEVQRATPALMLLDRVACELGKMRADPSLTVFDTIASDFGRILTP
jgi:glycosyltransferase involved in cell wall biosynthesis